ncbi:competence protein ComFB [Aphanothece hegewaldii CCALA 016]|uniref:Competence protein ComFB n=1 Tax=Aphanothece hegewaldii CCALA 016 TaxID=2107694 RepID=A0A2T1LRA1_9CHRO|nr:late competence development ComFB family protein [Aphanothece hegewaldii]PSF31121.1 competence protein ComFB [Aphanothece hegewaldii CCALA 016]
MNTIPHKSPQRYINVMEELVQEEINKQLKHYPHALVEYINQIEVATFALNRLPPLYASCEKGKNQQKILGQRKYKDQIKIAVRQGLAAVQRDPIRSSTPLISDYETAKTALIELQKMLEENELTDYEKLTWENLVSVIKRSLHRVMWKVQRQTEHHLPPTQSLTTSYFLGDSHDSWR